MKINTNCNLSLIKHTLSMVLISDENRLMILPTGVESKNLKDTSLQFLFLITSSFLFASENRSFYLLHRTVNYIHKHSVMQYFDSLQRG